MSYSSLVLDDLGKAQTVTVHHRVVTAARSACYVVPDVDAAASVPFLAVGFAHCGRDVGYGAESIRC
jgi:hypothetical protein